MTSQVVPYFIKVKGRDLEYLLVVSDGYGCYFFTRQEGIKGLKYLLHEEKSIDVSLYDRLMDELMKLPIPNGNVVLLPASNTIQ